MSPAIRKPAASRRQRSPAPGDTLSERAPKRSQRERLVRAMIELAAQVGYQSVSIAQVSTLAGVSSATFYEQFEDKEDCLLAAYQVAAEGLLDQALPIAGDGNWPDAARKTLGRLSRALERDPDAGRLLFVQTLAGGPRIRDTRRLIVGSFEQHVQDFLDSTPDGSDTLDVPAIALLGAMRTVVARYLRTHGEDELPKLADDAVAWISSYAVPAGQEHWSTSASALLPAPPEQPGRSASGRRPRRLPRGRHGLPPGVIARSQRTRIIYGTAEVMMAKGYANATVADIVAAAGVSRDVFYEHFTDKQHAFLEAQQHPTQHIVDTCAAAFFSAGDWPERVWRTFDALIRMIAENPAISHLRLIECYAAGPDAVRRAQEITRSFTIFFEEGYSYRPQARGLPRVCSQAIAGAIFEVIQRHVARRDTAGLARRLPQLTYIAIAPFMGPDEAVRKLERLIDRRVAASEGAEGDATAATYAHSASQPE
jgi:AcrR family transcriptional regulator